MNVKEAAAACVWPCSLLSLQLDWMFIHSVCMSGSAQPEHSVLTLDVQGRGADVEEPSAICCELRLWTLTLFVKGGGLLSVCVSNTLTHIIYFVLYVFISVADNLKHAEIRSSF